jgi:aspartyl-tRNA(Asn)/glutamyl-tRNA(Gln) amidotransferase subunit B
VRRPGDALGVRCEIKNLNSFRFMEQAIKFEVGRQIELIETGGKVVQETRLYDPDKNETRPMRSKEDAMDYRYFPDPDLLPLAISPRWIDEVRRALPELPRVKRERFTHDFGLSSYDAAALTTSLDMADYFEACIAAVGKDNAKLCANWLMGEVSARLNKEGLEITACPIPADSLAMLIDLIARGTITNKIAKDVVFPRMWEFGKQNVPGTFTLSGPGNPGTIVMDLGLQQVSDSGEIEKIVDQVIAANAQQIAAYRSGKPKAFNSLVGQVMKATKGKANPAQVNELLKRKLEK